MHSEFILRLSPITPHLNVDIISAGPTKRGHQAAKNFLESVYLFLRLQWNRITALTFFAFSHFGSSKRSIFHFSCLMSHASGPVGLFTVTQKTTHRPKPTRGSGSGMTPESHQNSSIFEPVSKATKAMKIGPKATQNHEKSTLES